MIELDYKNVESSVIGFEHGLNIKEVFDEYKQSIAGIIADLNKRKDKPGQWLRWMNLG